MLSKADLVSTMGEFQSAVTQQIKQQSDLLLFQIGKVMDAQMGDMRKEFHAKHTEQDSKIARLEARMALVDNKFEEFLAARQQDEKKMQALQETMAADEAQSYVDLDWDAVPDQTKLRINTTSNVSRACLLSALGSWLSNFDSDNWTLLGPSVGVDRDWSIKFSGQAGPAARRAKKAMQLLRNEDGSWHKYQAESPSGEAVDIFIANDKSPKQRRVETLTK
eukprot:5332075-Karenia_brevis.AAC.1